MEFLASVGVEIVKGVGEQLWGITRRQIGYIVHYKRNVDNLKGQVCGDLKRKRDDIKRLVDEGEKKLEGPKEEVKEWLKKVDSMGVDVRRIDEEARENKRWCPDWRLRYQLGKEAASKLDVVKGLIDKDFSSNLCIPSPLENTSPYRDFRVFRSTKLAKKKVMDSLNSEGINIIGVYGMGGVGKTTLFKEVGKEVKSAKFYD
ncbi:putative disease resistance protein At1g12290 [Tasmannia lanceolata]|uniref:putative disease resistance protein At1g12290 n=1 Tax=Tasmannia lanceolata TaxID=3420 RepID=UPI004062BAE3